MRTDSISSRVINSTRPWHCTRKSATKSASTLILTAKQTRRQAKFSKAKRLDLCSSGAAGHAHDGHTCGQRALNARLRVFEHETLFRRDAHAFGRGKKDVRLRFASSRRDVERRHDDIEIRCQTRSGHRGPDDVERTAGRYRSRVRAADFFEKREHRLDRFQLRDEREKQFFLLMRQMVHVEREPVMFAK